MQNLIFEMFQSALIWLILMHFKKVYFVSKCVDLVPNLNTLKILFKVRNFSKCVVTQKSKQITVLS